MALSSKDVEQREWGGEFGARRFDLRGPTSCGCFPIDGRQKATNGAVRKAWTLVPYIVTILIIRADTTRRTKSESP